MDGYYVIVMLTCEGKLNLCVVICCHKLEIMQTLMFMTAVFLRSVFIKRRQVQRKKKKARRKMISRETKGFEVESTYCFCVGRQVTPNLQL
jgi:hypothetical protein